MQNIRYYDTIIMPGWIGKQMRHYLVDSENVNDNWLMLLEFTEMTDDIIVFYTDNINGI